MYTQRQESSAIGSLMMTSQINTASQSAYLRMARISCLGKVHKAMTLILLAWAIKGSLFSRLSISRRAFRDTWWVKRPSCVPNHPRKMRTPTWPLKSSKVSKIIGPTTLSKWLTCVISAWLYNSTTTEISWFKLKRPPSSFAAVKKKSFW